MKSNSCPLVQSPQLGLKMNPPPIQEKPAKTTKKAPPTKEELQKMTVSRFYSALRCHLCGKQTQTHCRLCPYSLLKETLVKEYMNNKNVEQAISAAKEMKPPKHFLSEMLNKMVVYSLDRSDEDREHTSTLIHTLCTEGMVTGEHLLQVCLADINEVSLQVGVSHI